MARAPSWANRPPATGRVAPPGRRQGPRSDRRTGSCATCQSGIGPSTSDILPTAPRLVAREGSPVAGSVLVSGVLVDHALPAGSVAGRGGRPKGCWFSCSFVPRSRRVVRLPGHVSSDPATASIGRAMGQRARTHLAPWPRALLRLGHGRRQPPGWGLRCGRRLEAVETGGIVSPRRRDGRGADHHRGARQPRRLQLGRRIEGRAPRPPGTWPGLRQPARPAPRRNRPRPASDAA